MQKVDDSIALKEATHLDHGLAVLLGVFIGPRCLFDIAIECLEFMNRLLTSLRLLQNAGIDSLQIHNSRLKAIAKTSWNSRMQKNRLSAFEPRFIVFKNREKIYSNAHMGFM